jgi:hypothetical protein
MAAGIASADSFEIRTRITKIFRRLISTRGRHRCKHQRKGKEEETAGKWKEREMKNKMKLTHICSNRFFTFIALYTYVGKNDSAHPSTSSRLPTAPPPLASWTESPHSFSLPFPPRKFDVLFDDPDPEATFPWTFAFSTRTCCWALIVLLLLVLGLCGIDGVLLNVRLQLSRQRNLHSLRMRDVQQRILNNNCVTPVSSIFNIKCIREKTPKKNPKSDNEQPT